MNERTYFEQFVGDTKRYIIHGIFQTDASHENGIAREQAEQHLGEYSKTHQGDFIMRYIGSQSIAGPTWRHTFEIVQLIDA